MAENNALGDSQTDTGSLEFADCMQALESAEAEIRDAQQQLQAAKTALEAGREPKPGERIGTAGGASRLADAYARRLKALEDAVTTAQKRLDDAYSRRNAAR